MGDISKHFSRGEFECKCGCGFDTVDAVLLNVMEGVRNHYGRPVVITGPNRCAFQNAATPGAAKMSLHTEAKACDFRVEGISSASVYEYLNAEYPNEYGLGLYNNRVHVDVRPVKARWNSV